MQVSNNYGRLSYEDVISLKFLILTVSLARYTNENNDNKQWRREIMIKVIFSFEAPCSRKPPFYYYYYYFFMRS